MISSFGPAACRPDTGQYRRCPARAASTFAVGKRVSRSTTETYGVRVTRPAVTVGKRPLGWLRTGGKIRERIDMHLHDFERTQQSSGEFIRKPGEVTEFRPYRAPSGDEAKGHSRHPARGTGRGGASAPCVARRTRSRARAGTIAGRRATGRRITHPVGRSHCAGPRRCRALAPDVHDAGSGMTITRFLHPSDLHSARQS